MELRSPELKRKPPLRSADLVKGLSSPLLCAPAWRPAHLLGYLASPRLAACRLSTYSASAWHLPGGCDLGHSLPCNPGSRFLGGAEAVVHEYRAPPGPGAPRVRGRSAVKGAGRPVTDKRGRVTSSFFGFSGLPHKLLHAESRGNCAPFLLWFTRPSSVLLVLRLSRSGVRP